MKYLILSFTLVNSVLIIFLTLKIKNMAISLQEALDKIKVLDQKTTDLQTTVDAEQADIAALVANNATVVSELTAQRDALQAIIDAGGQATDLQPILDAVDAVIAKVDAASADVSTTV